jgi:putative nucleotidyltransferase with HDIG domain
LRIINAESVIRQGRVRSMLPYICCYLMTVLLISAAFGSLVYLVLQTFNPLTSPVPLTVVLVIAFIAALTARPVMSRFQVYFDSWFYQESGESIEVLKRFNRGATGTPELETVASSLVTAVANGLQGRGVYLLLPSRATGSYSTFTYAGQRSRGRLYFSSSSPLVTTMKQQDGIIDRCEIELMPSLIDLKIYDRQALEDNDIEFIAPLKNAEHLAGILLVGPRISGEPYSTKEKLLVQEVASGIAESIDDANYYASAKLQQKELQKALDGVIHAISLVVEMTDPYTAGHQRRVAELAAAISRQIGLTEWQTMGVRIAGLFHDVGKVAVPPEILNKPGKLDQYELNIIRSHSRVGYDILKKIDFPWPVARAVLQHHERLDGSGYPLGLAADDVSFEARILGVADVVEAMASHRPYRPSLGLDAALEEISKGSGVLYDAEVAQACLGLLSPNPLEFERIMAAAGEEGEAVPEIALA